MNFFFRSLLLLLSVWLPVSQAADSGWLRDAQNNHAEVRLRSAPANDATRQFLLDIKLQPGWKTYWRTPGEGGVAPTIHWDNAAVRADWQWPTPARFDVSGLTTQGYHGDVSLPIRLHNVNGPRLAGILTLSTCSNVCILTDYPFSLDLTQPVDTRFMQDFARAAGQVPVKAGLVDDVSAAYAVGEVQIRAQRAGGWKAPQLFFDNPAGAMLGEPAVKAQGDVLEARVPVTDEWGEHAPDIAGMMLSMVLADGDIAQQTDVEIGRGKLFGQEGNFWQIALFALLGGLILNLMPCVLPVLAMKLGSLVQQQGQTRCQTRKQFLASSAGILASFLLLAGVMHMMRISGQALGWGIQFQSPLFLAIMVLVTFLFSASLFDLLHIRLPSSWNTRLATQGGNGMGGHFLQGAFATLLATPCSAPFLGTALAYALTAPLTQMWLLFAFLGAGMSLPWLLVAALPGLARLLPRPGRWMIHLRVVLGLMMFLASLWLLSLLISHWGHTVTLIAAGALTAALLIWLLNHKAVAQAIIVFCCVTLLSVWLLISREVPETDRLHWQPLTEAAISSALTQNKRVFIDVTADWCITCKVNKRILRESDVQKTLASDDVVLLRGDWTQTDPLISEFLKQRGSVAVPFNQIYGPGLVQGSILSPLLTRDAVLSAMNKAKEQ